MTSEKNTEMENEESKEEVQATEAATERPKYREVPDNAHLLFVDRYRMTDAELNAKAEIYARLEYKRY